MTHLLDVYGFRMGAEEKEDQGEETGIGVTDLTTDHVASASDEAVKFQFVGKARHGWEVIVDDPESVAMLNGLLEGKGPGERIFSYSTATDVSDPQRSMHVRVKEIDPGIERSEEQLADLQSMVGARAVIGEVGSRGDANVTLRFTQRHAPEHVGKKIKVGVNELEGIGGEEAVRGVDYHELKNHVSQTLEGGNPKDFRTLMGTREFVQHLMSQPLPETTGAREIMVDRAVQVAQEALHHASPATTRNNYIDPVFAEKYVAGELDELPYAYHLIKSLASMSESEIWFRDFMRAFTKKYGDNAEVQKASTPMEEYYNRAGIPAKGHKGHYRKDKEGRVAYVEQKGGAKSRRYPEKVTPTPSPGVAFDNSRALITQLQARISSPTASEAQKAKAKQQLERIKAHMKTLTKAYEMGSFTNQALMQPLGVADGSPGNKPMSGNVYVQLEEYKKKKRRKKGGKTRAQSCE
jgi:hypothetical protein